MVLSVLFVSFCCDVVKGSLSLEAAWKPEMFDYVVCYV